MNLSSHSWAAPVTVTAGFIHKLFLRRHLIWNFVIRDLKGRYVGSLMGLLWSVIHPLVLLVSYTFVFSVIFEIRASASDSQPFAVFLFCGILPWLYFQDTVLRSSTSIVENSNLLRKTIFPSEILPVTIAISNLVNHLVGFSILLTVLIFLNTLGWNSLLIPIYLLLLVLLALGLGWLSASLQVFLRDTSQVLSVVMVLWFWFTPIFYRLDQVPAQFRPWIQLNPLTHVVIGYRDLLLFDQLPPLRSLLLLAVFSTSSFLVGGFVFRNTKREFVDVL